MINVDKLNHLFCHSIANYCNEFVHSYVAC